MSNLKQKTLDALLAQGHLNNDQVASFQMIGFQCIAEDDTLTLVQLSVAYDSSINFSWDTSHQLIDHTFNLFVELDWVTKTSYIKIKSNNSDEWTQTFYLPVDEQSIEGSILALFELLQDKEPQNRLLALTKKHPKHYKEFLAGSEKLTTLLDSSTLQDLFTKIALNKDVV